MRRRQGTRSWGVKEVGTNGGVLSQISAMERNLDMLVKAMSSQGSAQAKQVAQVEVCVICSNSDNSTKTSFSYQE